MGIGREQLREDLRLKVPAPLVSQSFSHRTGAFSPRRPHHSLPVPQRCQLSGSQVSQVCRNQTLNTAPHNSGIYFPQTHSQNLPLSQERTSQSPLKADAMWPCNSQNKARLCSQREQSSSACEPTHACNATHTTSLRILASHEPCYSLQPGLRVKALRCSGHGFVLRETH